MDIWVFVQKNVFLVIVCVVSGVMLIWPLIGKAATGAVEISPQEAVNLINRRDALVLDVQEATEFATGHLLGAKGIPLAELENRLGELDKAKARPIVVSCRTGSRAGTACAVLKKSGFGEVFALKGGVAAWQQASLPVEK